MTAMPTDLMGQQPTVRIPDLAALTDIADELVAYHAAFAPLYRRREQRRWGEVYLRGLLLAEVPRKNCAALALRLLGAGDDADGTVRALQDFIGVGGWDDAALLAVHRRLVDETLGDPDGVLLIDGSDVPKQGNHSVGVARQWCGHSGKKDNCQAGVYLGYASASGYTLLDRRLYLPACWFTAEYADRWRACGIPRGTPFQTKHDLAATLVEAALAAGTLRARGVVCDEGYGDSPALLDRWAATGLRYLAELPRDTQGWFLTAPDGQAPPPAPQTWVPPQAASKKGPAPRRSRLRPDSPPKARADAWAAQVPAARWQRYRVLAGGKGPLVADFVAVRWVPVRDRLPGPEGWLLVRRSLPTDPAEEPDYKYYGSNAPADTPLATLVWASGMRWPIEACFAEARQEVGLDHDETRSWRGWHHHLTLVILAHHFLVRLQQRLDPREGGLRAGPVAPDRDRRPVGPAAAARPAHPQPRPGPRAATRLPALARPRPAAGARPAPLSPTPQARRLPRPPGPPTPLAR
jgi:SRSO17 transposase